MPSREIVQQTRRERQVNYGDSATAIGGRAVTLFHTDSLESTSRVLYVQPTRFFIPPGDVGTADFRPFVRVSWGHGASSVEADFDVTYRQRIPLACSDVDVQLMIKALPLPGGDTTVVPAAATVTARAFVADGSDAIDLVPTVWGSQLDVSNGVIATTAARLATLRAVNPGAGLVYLLLFDAAAVPAPGAVPVDVMSLPNGAPPISLALGQTRAFVNGIAWAISSTPFTLTNAANPIALAFELES